MEAESKKVSHFTFTNLYLQVLGNWIMTADRQRSHCISYVNISEPVSRFYYFIVFCSYKTQWPIALHVDLLEQIQFPPRKEMGLCNIEIGEIAEAEEFLSFCGCKEKLMLEKRE